MVEAQQTMHIQDACQDQAAVMAGLDAGVMTAADTK
jgi:hypothetical protein